MALSGYAEHKKAYLVLSNFEHLNKGLDDFISSLDLLPSAVPTEKKGDVEKIIPPQASFKRDFTKIVLISIVIGLVVALILLAGSFFLIGQTVPLLAGIGAATLVIFCCASFFLFACNNSKPSSEVCTPSRAAMINKHIGRDFVREFEQAIEQGVSLLELSNEIQSLTPAVRLYILV